MRWFLLFVWIELIVVFSLGCISPKDKRGDWMENLSGITFEPIDWGMRRSPWYRNYRTMDELKSDWDKVYKQAMLEFEENTP